jgi:hypothetical protein
MNSRLKLGSILVLLLVCCGEDRFFVQGHIRGYSFNPGDAVWGTGSVRVNNVTVNAAVILMSSASNLCSLARAGRQPRSSQFMTIILSDMGAPPTAPGAFTIWVSGTQPTRLAFAQFSVTDANCQQIVTTTATSGTVNVGGVSSNGNISGNFDLFFDSGDHVTGSFSATNCSALVSGIATSTCG